MAVKKETAQQAAEAATQDTKDVQAEKPATEVIHLFKDNGRYSSARFVSVNGEAYLIQRGGGRGGACGGGRGAAPQRGDGQRGQCEDRGGPGGGAERAGTAEAVRTT